MLRFHGSFNFLSKLMQAANRVRFCLNHFCHEVHVNFARFCLNHFCREVHVNCAQFCLNHIFREVHVRQKRFR